MTMNPTQAQIEAAAKALSVARGYPEDWWDRSPMNQTGFLLEAKAALLAANEVMEQERKRNCIHLRRTGTGSLGSNGLGWSTWYCYDCGASYDSRMSSEKIND